MVKAKEKQKFIIEVGNGSGKMQLHAYVRGYFCKYHKRYFWRRNHNLEMISNVALEAVLPLVAHNSLVS